MKFSIFHFHDSKKTQKNKTTILGFTLLELLVVISIIAVLLTVGITSFSTAQKKGRDSKRKSDLKEVQGALEQYYTVCGYQYPSLGGNPFYSSISCASPSVAIMPTMPVDPRASPYACDSAGAACSTSNYVICAWLESETTDKYCLSNQQ